MVQKSSRHVWRSNNIELIFAYFAHLNDENDERSFIDFGINLSRDFQVSYDYETGKINIVKTKMNSQNNFWSYENKKANINNISLILGENGIGKSTLLKALNAAMYEPINKYLGEYLLLFYDKSIKKYFMKTTCNIFFENNFISELNMDDDSQNVFFDGESEGKKIRGYIGYTTINNAGKVTAEKYRIINIWPELGPNYNARVPMSSFYLPVSADKNVSRYVKKSKATNIKVDTSDVETLKFFINDYKLKERRNIYRYPKIQLVSNGFSEENVRGNDKNRKYHSLLRSILNMIDIKNKIIKYDFQSTAEKKYAFFMSSIIFYICELYCNKDEKIINELLTDLRRVLAKNEKDYPWERKYHEMFRVLRRYYPHLYSGGSPLLKKLKQAIEDIPKDYFMGGIIDFSGKCATATLLLESIMVDAGNALVNLINVCEEICISQNDEHKSFNSLKYTEMSTGEIAFVRDVFARISTVVNGIEKAPNTKSVLLILDEPDVSLHIRWTQKLVDSIIRLLNNQYSSHTFQIIMTSHMPFLVTDFPRDCVVCLADHSWREEHKIDVNEYVDGSEVERGGIRGFHPKKSFMCNYYDLLREAFFIDVPVGLFAQKKYGELNSKLNGNFENGEISEKEYNELKNSIDMIDEPILRDSLNKRLINDQTKEKRLSEIRKNIEYLKNLERELLGKND